MIMPTMYKELVEVLNGLVKFEYECERLEDCEDCCIKKYSCICEGVPSLIETIQGVLYNEC